jgi:hypothetical protein
MATEAPGADAAEVAAIAAATSALEGYAFHLVPEPGDRARSGGGGGQPTEDDAREARDSGTFRGLTDVVLLARSTDTFRRLARDAPRPGEVCVDVGSAHGDATKRMAKAVGSEANVTGLDVSPDFVRLSGAKYPGITFERLDVLEDTAFFADILAKKSPDCVFVDIGGVRAAEALVRALPVIAGGRKANDKCPRLVAVKCEALAEKAKETCLRALNGEGPIVRLPESFWLSVCASEVKAARNRSSHKSKSTSRNAAPANKAFARYPLRYPKKVFVSKSSSGEGDREVEICRFHNYAEAGCLRLKQGTCCLNHTACHWCGKEGHKASACAEAAEAAKSAGTAGLAPAAPPTRDPNDGTSGDGVTDGDSSGTSAYVYCVGGRNRGQTVGVVERLCLETLTWSRAPRLNAPRGSHGVAAAGNVVFAVGGGGVRSNLHDAEALRVEGTPGEGLGSSWEPRGFVSEARHAVAACATGDWGIFLIGGWGDGDSCTGAADALILDDAFSFPHDFSVFGDSKADPRSLKGGRGWVPSDADLKSRWRSLPRLSTPRKLHAAAGLRDGRLFAFGGRTSDDPNVGPTDSAETFRVPSMSDDGSRGVGSSSSSASSHAWKPVSPLPAGGACACACVDDADRRADAVYVLTWGASSGGSAKAVPTTRSKANRIDKRARKAGEAARLAALARGATEDDAVAEGNAARAAARAAEEKKETGVARSGAEVGGLWRYDADDDTYAFLADLPLPEWYGFTAAAHEGWVYAIGGSTKGRWTGAAFRFPVGGGLKGDAGDGEWEELPGMEMVRRRTAAAVVRVRR